MKGYMVVLVFAISLAWVGAGLAHEGEVHTQSITGEVVDLACYLGHGESGAGHRECARKCIASGLPVGIKAGDTVYLAVGAEHGTANAALAALAADEVTVEGEVSQRDGIHLVAIQKVTAKK